MTWGEIPGLDQNGIVINYEIQVEQLDFLTDIIFVDPLNTTDFGENVTGLQEYVSYDFRVRAYTSIGPGLYSNPVTKRTSEDGNVHILLTLCLRKLGNQTFIFQSSVPAAPPRDVQATAISSTEIMVTWDEIRGLDQNGVIIEYEVQIEPLDSPANNTVGPLNTTRLLIVVTSLEELFYNISVRAYTSVGPGPYSDPVTVRTSEDGNVLYIFVFSATISLLIYQMLTFH